YHAGLVSGYDCGANCLEFRPGNNVTRGQIAKIVVLAAGWPLLDPPTATFRDVPVGSVFFRYVETAYDRGIISGYGCGVGCLEFRPGNSATRGQICKIVYGAVKVSGRIGGASSIGPGGPVGPVGPAGGGRP